MKQSTKKFMIIFTVILLIISLFASLIVALFINYKETVCNKKAKYLPATYIYCYLIEPLKK